MFFSQIAMAQENQTCRDNAFNFILQHVKSISARPWKIKSDSYYKMPNGGYIVYMTIGRTLTLEEEKWVPNQVQAFGATFNMGIKRGKTHTNYEDWKSFMLFLDKSGEPLSIQEPYYKCKIEYFDNAVCFVKEGGEIKVGIKKIQTDDKFIFYSFDGKKIGEMDDLMIFSKLKTSNNYYLAGEIITPNGARSVIRVLDLKTLKTKDTVGAMGDINYNLRTVDTGVGYTCYKDNDQTEELVVPFEPNDKSFHAKSLVQKFSKGLPSDKVHLGELYLKSDVLGKDEKKAFELFQTAAHQGDEVGLYRVANCYLKGIGVPSNSIEAISYFEKSANKGYTDAMVTLSNLYSEGIDVGKDMSKALYWKERLGFLDNIEAQKDVISHSSMDFEHVDYNADELLNIARKNIKSTNYPWARYCYERAIALGSSEAVFEYSKWLYEGNGIARDCDKAIEYLTKLGEKNNLNAQKLLINIYKDNNGVKPDLQKEMYWVEKAAENNDVDSQVRLGAAFLIAKDKKKSAEWYEKAALRNHQDAIKVTITNYMNGNGVKKDLDKAVSFFTRLDSKSQLEYADNVFNGIGMKKNQKLGASMYEKMSQNGNKKATKKLALCYVEGLGVSKNIEKAYQLAMSLRNTTHDGGDGDIYYIEGKYQETKISMNRAIVGNALECYDRAIKCGNTQASQAKAKLKAKYGLR